MGAWVSDLALILVTLIWGVTFSITKEGVVYMDPLLYLAFRFGMAYLLLRPVSYLLERRKYTWEETKIGAGAAFFFFTGFVTQTAALQYTTASKAAFITGLSVVLVPILSIIILKEKPHRMAVIGAFVAFLGLAALSVEPGMPTWIGFGDLLALACAFSFAGHILFIGHYANSIKPIPFSTIQIGFVALLSAVIGVFKGPIPDFTALPATIWWGLAYLAVLATMTTTLLQTWAQQQTSSTRTAVIFTLEPVFAAIFAFLMLGEAITLRTIIGGSFIIAGILLAELGPQMKEAPQAEPAVPES
ncbi:MAG: DMT family transporter [Firmicutes bacterium]|nr:DMT family transporter [Bacillota bacterium]